jgi:hypothetical protein
VEKAEWQLRIMPRTASPGQLRNLTVTKAGYVQNGRRLAGITLPDDTAALLDQASSFLALYRQEGPDAVAASVFV